jgi:hypothetical protein
MHGGKNERAEPGDPVRGGRPPITGYYSKYLREGMRLAYDDAQAVIGSLDDEIKVARAYLTWAIERHQENPAGGEAISVAKNTEGGTVRVRMRFYSDIVADLIDRIRRLELSREALKHGAGGDDSRGALRGFMDRVRKIVGDASDQ